MEIIKSKKGIRCYSCRVRSWRWNGYKVLSDAGIKVALVEAGPYFDPANPEQQTQLKWTWESPRRGALELIEHLVTFTCLMETGLWMGNHILL